MAEFGSRAESEYVALIGDVVDSRNSSDRKGLQERLLREIHRLNRSDDGAFLSPLALTAGDEVQVVLTRPENVVDVVVALSDAIAPEKIIFGVGFGALSTQLDSDVARMDGPCLHRAREALGEVKTDRWLVARGFGAVLDQVLSAVFNLIYSVRSRWKPKQLSYARAARSDREQKEIAAEFGVNPSVVSESLKASSFSVVQEGERAARHLLEEFGSRAESALNSGKEPN